MLEGELELHTECYAPLVLKAGESIYFDSRMGHGYVARGTQTCRALSMCTVPQHPVSEERVRAARRRLWKGQPPRRLQADIPRMSAEGALARRSARSGVPRSAALLQTGLHQASELGPTADRIGDGQAEPGGMLGQDTVRIGCAQFSGVQRDSRAADVGIGPPCQRSDSARWPR